MYLSDELQDDAGCQEPETLQEMELVEGMMYNGAGVAWSNSSRFPQLLSLLLETMAKVPDLGEKGPVSSPSSQHGDAGVVAHPPSHPPDAPGLFAPHGCSARRLHTAGCLRRTQILPHVPSQDHTFFVGMLYAACKGELRQPDGRHAVILAVRSELVGMFFQTLLCRLPLSLLRRMSGTEHSG